MLRFGFFVGFLIGAAAGTVLSQEEGTDDAQPAQNAGARGAIKEIKDKAMTQIQLAREAAHLESEAKQQEMLHEFEIATRHSDKD